jgi:hypothetical protein
VVHGVNPYTSYNVLRAEQSLGCPTFMVTPLRSGIFAQRVAPPTDSELQAAARAQLAGNTNIGGILLGFDYPAGSALAGIAGAHGVALLDALALIAAWLMAVRSAPVGLRRWIAISLGAQTSALALVGVAHPDAFAVALLIISCTRRSGVVGGATLGLACAIKQTIWFVAPALVLLAWREGAKTGLRHNAAAASAFAVINLPFVVFNSAAWFSGMLTHQLNPEFPQGLGPVGFFANGGNITVVVVVFSVVMGVTVVAGTVMAWRLRGGLAEAGVIVAGLALWDGPRSLFIYLATLGVLTVAICSRGLWSTPVIELAQHAGQVKEPRELSAAHPARA